MTSGEVNPARPMPATCLAAQRGEIKQLTGVRWFAALWVVAFHQSYIRSGHFPTISTFFHPIVITGDIGVDLFYVLSGFVITHTYIDQFATSGHRLRTASSYVWARICRMWPAYAVMTNLFAAVILYRYFQNPGPHAVVAVQTVQPAVSVWSWIKQMLMVQLWNQPFLDGSSWIGAAWSISAEWFMYLVFAVAVGWLLILARRLPRPVLFALSFLAVLPFAYQGYHTGAPYHPWNWMFRIGGGFLAGAFMCLAVRQMPLTERVRARAAVIAGFAFVQLLIILWWNASLPPDHSTLGVLTFPALIGGLAMSTTGLSRWMSHRWVVHGGRISYSLYLVHVPVFEVIELAQRKFTLLDPATKFGALVPAEAFLLVILLADLLWRLVEEPARKAMRSRDPAVALSRWQTRRSARKEQALAA